MANELWKQRVQRAQEAAAGRRGVDVSVMLPPRNPSADGSTHQAEKAVVEPIAAPVVMEAVAVVETAAPAAAPAPAASSEAADRVAAAKAKAAAKAASADKPAVPAPKPAAPRPAAPAKASPVAEAPAEVGQAGMNRREFVTYAWAAALGLVTLEGGLATFQFMYPRFKAGQFGGKIDVTSLPPTDASPQANTTGKFWLVNTDAGPKAIYMVCTHLGCLYKWEPSNNRFECPCHGSKFSREGFYIEGPAARSLDQFIVEVEENGVVSVTENSDQGAIPPAVLSPSAEIRVNTGKRIPGRPAAESPSKVAI